MSDSNSVVSGFGAAIGAQWPHIDEARLKALAKLNDLYARFESLEPDETSIVVLGSLGRHEFTDSSDLDWNLLLDGYASPHHHSLFLSAEKSFRDLASRGVGRAGTFGAFVSSHDLVHNIGGEDDTNNNTTRRLLLLLEAEPVGRRDAYDRVVRNILNRYLLDDRSLWRGTAVDRHHIPHFLLNDFARFWRTMAVDFAQKLRARSGDGWALRNLKLRFSRKLLYVAGLIACYRCHLDFDDEEREARFGDPNRKQEMVEHLRAVFRLTPLEIVAEFFSRYPHLHSVGRRFFNAYDGFLEILLQGDTREHLERLTEDAASADPVFKRAQEASHVFRDAILALFFDERTEVGKLTKLYGVF
jgi:hypothetical protein